MRVITRWVINAGLMVLRAYWRVFNPITVGVRAVVHDADGGVLLVRHEYGDNHLHLPGGGVKRRETLVSALRRELHEETGLEILVEDHELRLLGVYTNFIEGKSDHVAVFVVSAGQWKGELNHDNVEIARIRFEDSGDLPVEVSPGTRRRLAELAGDVQPTYEW